MEAEEHRGSDEITEMFCELCRKKGKTVSADGFCVDCVRYFCMECVAYHGEFLPDHIFQDKKSMPHDVCLQQCPGHDEEIIKFFCSSCKTFFCQLCKKNDHSNCKDVKHLPQLVDQLEQGNEFKQFKEELEGLVNEVRNIESGIERDKESIEVISAKALSKMESRKQHLIKCLNKRFQEIQAEIQNFKQTDKIELENNSTKLSTVKEQIDSISSNVEQLLKEEERCKLFMIMKEAQSKHKQFADYLCLLKEHKITNYEFEHAQDDRLLRNVLQLGKLECKHSEDLTVEKAKPQTRHTLCSSLSDNKETNIQGNIHIKVSSDTKIKRKIQFDSDQFPDIEVQKSYIAEQLQRPLIVDEVWFVLDVKWFKQWKSYVGYETWDHYNVGELCSHPGQIDNTPILEGGTMELKQHLIDDLDYVLVPDEGWKKLVYWYGMADGQEPLPRKVIEEEGVCSKSLKVEMYLWKLKLCEYSNPDYEVSKLVSRADTIGQLEQVMRETFHIETEKEVRLWNRYMTNTYGRLTKKECKLQDAGLYCGQVILIEQRNCDGTWPRNKQ